MATRRKPDVEPVGLDLVITRVFDAPRELVFKAWTDPKHLEQWWGPNGFTNPVCEVEVRPGGAILIHMRGPDGTVYRMTGVFREVIEPELLAFTASALGDGGRPVLEVMNTATFAEHDRKTKLTLHARVLSTAPEGVPHLEGMEEGWTQSLERLGDHLASTQGALAGGMIGQTKGMMGTADREIVISRVFDAPRELVFKAWTEPERLKEWWGPKGFAMRTLKLDLRPGGVFHYCMRAPNGGEVWGKFVYREIAAPERIVFVNSFSDAKGNLTRHPMSPSWPLEILNTLTLTEHEGRTTLRLQGGPINATEEERKTFEAGHKSMQQGFAGTFDQLAAYLAKARGRTEKGDLS